MSSVINVGEMMFDVQIFTKLVNKAVVDEKIAQHTQLNRNGAMEGMKSMKK